MTHQPTLRTPADGRTIAVVGDVYRFLATGEDTNGKYAIWEAIVPPGGGPPPHVHSREEEGFYILEGEITFQINDERVVATAGMFANMPVGTQHSFKNESTLPAKMLISVAPAGLEQMFFTVQVAFILQSDQRFVPRRGIRTGFQATRSLGRGVSQALGCNACRRVSWERDQERDPPDFGIVLHPAAAMRTFS